MQTEHHDHIEHEPGSRPVAHEESDVNVRAIAAFIIGLFVVGAIIHVALFGLFGFLGQQAAESDPRVAPVAIPAGTPPPEPRLLTNEPLNLEQLHKEEDAQLANIEQAKKAVVDQHLPARADGKMPAETWPRELARMGTSSGRRQ
jgi:hypothetical protein